MRAAFEKDAHVVAAALCADRIIISNEVRLRLQLAELAGTDERLGAIMWASPAEEREACTAWIINGAPFEQDRAIG
jgi:hypothetical protein